MFDIPLCFIDNRMARKSYTGLVSSFIWGFFGYFFAVAHFTFVLLVLRELLERLQLL